MIVPLESPRDRLVDAIMTFLGGRDLLTWDDVRVELEREIDNAGPDALVALRAQLVDGGADWEYYPPDPLARRIHHTLADRFLSADSRLTGIEHAIAALDGPLVVMANHLSYADANVLEILLRRSGGASVADRLTAMAGPKVFSSRQRRFSSLCFGTIRVPQSSALSTDQAVMSARDVARAARRSIDVAHARLAQGDALLLFGEGVRSRSGAMQPLLAGVARYLDVPDTQILPVGIVGTDALFPVGEDTLHPARVGVRLGRPIHANALVERARGDRQLTMDAVGLAIAELLSPESRGVYGNGATDSKLDEARSLVDDLRRSP